MSENRIRKVFSATDPVPRYGPHSAGVFVDGDTNSLAWNADGTVRSAPDVFPVVVPVDGTNAVDGDIFLAYQDVTVVAIESTFAAQGGAASSAVITKCTGTTVPASGTALHATGIDTGTATVNTLRSVTLTSSAATLNVADGDRLAIDYKGTTAPARGVITVWLKKNLGVA